MRSLVLAVLLLASAPAWCQTTWLHVLGRSWHAGSGYNDNNLGLGVETALQPGWSLAAGTYRNSIDRDSWYLLAKRQFWNHGPWTAHLNMGVATGYQVTPVAPVILPEMCVHWLCAIAVPQIGQETTGALALYLRIPIK